MDCLYKEFALKPIGEDLCVVYDAPGQLPVIIVIYI